MIEESAGVEVHDTERWMPILVLSIAAVVAALLSGGPDWTERLSYFLAGADFFCMTFQDGVGDGHEASG